MLSHFDSLLLGDSLRGEVMADLSFFLKDVLQYIQRDCDFMTRNDCVPVQIALQLIDSSTLGRADRYDDFQETHQRLQKALKAIVNGIRPCLVCSVS